jgi:hypothetical protein
MNSPAIAASEGVVLGHHGHPDRTTTAPKRVLAVVANPIVSTNNGWSVGFWASELTHSYDELTENGRHHRQPGRGQGRVRLDGRST